MNYLTPSLIKRSLQIIFIFFILITSFTCTRSSEKIEDDFLKELDTQIRENYFNNSIVADSLAKIGLTYSRKHGYQLKEGEMANFRGAIAFNNKSFDTAFVYYTHAHSIFEKKNNLKGLANTFNNLGTIQRNLGKNNVAIQNYNESLKLEKKLNRKEEILSVLNNISIVYEIQGKYQKALNLLYQEALPIIEELDNNKNTFEKKANIYYSIGTFYYQLEQFEKAITFAKKSLFFAEKANIYIQEGLAYDYLCTHFLENSELDSAKVYLDSLVTVNKKIDGNLFNSAIEYRYTTYFLERKQLDSATLSLNKAFKENKKIKYVPLNDLLYKKGQLYQEKGKYNDAIDNYIQAFNLSNEYDEVKSSRDNLLRLSQCYTSIKESTKALKYLQQYIEFADSSQYLDLQKLTLNIEDKYQNDLLKKDITIEKQKSKVLRITLITVSLFLITATIFLYILRKRNQIIKENHEQLKEKKKKIEHQNKQLEQKNSELEIKNATITNQKNKLETQKDYLKELAIFHNYVQESATVYKDKTYKDIAAIGVKTPHAYIFFNDGSHIQRNSKNKSLTTWLTELDYYHPFDFVKVAGNFVINFNNIKTLSTIKVTDKELKTRPISHIEFKDLRIDIKDEKGLIFSDIVDKIQTTPRGTNPFFKEKYEKWKKFQKLKKQDPLKDTDYQ